ncbi:MAG TPA: penicillin-binding protein 2 [Xanthobacteraceae bacterium]|nr:penicillin-binding protein 2 [Xanthobacteraceae bacterium]
MENPAPIDPQAKSWRHYLGHSLMYGSDVDRGRKTKARIVLAIAMFGLIYGVISMRLVMFATMTDRHPSPRGVSQERMAARPDIVDRNGLVLATDVNASSLYAEPRRILDVDEAVELLTAVLPELDAPDVKLRDKLSSKNRGFVWLKREITAKQAQEIRRLGLPGIGFMTEHRRVYPNNAEVSHVLGYVNVDNQGQGGIERWIDTNGLAALHQAGLATDRSQKPVVLSIDLSVQHVLREELIAACDKYRTIAAAGMVLDVNTGEVVAMVSLPDYDPNDLKQVTDPTRFNRLTAGVFELGSTYKALTVAMALDSGRVSLGSSFDARQPLVYGKFTIEDFHAQRRILTVPEIFTYSSNIGTAKMALSLGIDYHKAFLKKLGQLDRLRTELPENREPMVPKPWMEINSATIAFGHGLSVTPLQAMMGIGALMNGGTLIPPTFLKRSEAQARELGVPVVKPETSDAMRYLMRLNVEKGTATRAEVRGYYVGGKTGTSEKVVDGRYSKHKSLNTFTAVLPADKPRFLLLVMLDEPEPTPDSNGGATAGLNAAPTAAKIIARIAPMLGLEPRHDLPTSERLILARSSR